MTDSMFDLYPEDSGLFENLVRAGSDIAGAAAGSAIGFVTASLPGAVAGAAAGPVITRGLLRLAAEFQQRVLSPRERVRVGAVFAMAVEKTRQNVMLGRQRNPALFGTEEQRSSATEICEALILSVQRDPQEKKVSLYANLIGNLPFEEQIDAGEAHQLTRFAQELTYRQLCLLAIFADPRRFQLRNRHHVGYPAMTPSLTSVLLDIYELWTKQIVQSGGLVLATYDLINPARIEVYGVGGRLYRLMELSLIDALDLEEVAQFLR